MLFNLFLFYCILFFIPCVREDTERLADHAYSLLKQDSSLSPTLLTYKPTATVDEVLAIASVLLEVHRVSFVARRDGCGRVIRVSPIPSVAFCVHVVRLGARCVPSAFTIAGIAGYIPHYGGHRHYSVNVRTILIIPSMPVNFTRTILGTLTKEGTRLFPKRDGGTVCLSFGFRPVPSCLVWTNRSKYFQQ